MFRAAAGDKKIMNWLKQRSSRSYQRFFFAAKLAVSLSLIAYLFSLFDFDTLRNTLSSLIPEFVIVAVALLLVQSLLSTLKWRTILAADGVHLGFLYLLKTYLIGNFVSLFLPTSFGGDIYRVMAVRKAAMSTAKTTSSVLFDRLTGLFALLSIAFIAYLTYPGLPFKWLVALIYLAGLLLFWLSASGWIVRRFRSVKSDLVQKILSIFVSFHTYAKNRRCLLIALAISFIFQLNVVVINKVYSLSLNLDVAFTALLVIIPLVYLTEAIPISINGLGVRESAFVFFYQQVGQTPESGFAVALLVLTLRYSMGLIGGLLLVSTVIAGRKNAATIRDRD